MLCRGKTRGTTLQIVAPAANYAGGYEQCTRHGPATLAFVRPIQALLWSRTHPGPTRLVGTSPGRRVDQPRRHRRQQLPWSIS